MFKATFGTILIVSTSLVTGHKNWNQCYYHENAVAPPELLPCQNETDVDPNDYTWCCFAGHECLDHSSCWDPKTTNTYQYGCNDETYAHSSCPRKCNLDPGKSSWTGLVLCEDKDRESVDQPWVCNHPETCGDRCPKESENPKATLSPWPFTLIELPRLQDRCADLGSEVTAFFAPDPIPSKGFVPDEATDIGSKPQASRVASKDSDDGGLSTGAIAGIAVGAAVGVIAILAGVFFMWRRRRAQKTQAPAPAPAPASAPAHYPQSSPAPQYHSPGMPSSPEPYPGYDKHNIVYPNSPSTFSDGTGIQRPVSDMSMSTVSPTPMGSPRPHPSQYYQQGVHPSQGPYGHGSHAELSHDARAVYEMPEIREKPDRSELP
ncbi:hypothetical protein CGMCC3_g8223 [Colletotrichum fructicola]|nr:uncharacterized protein CGMCC3_g8223 [Colletotrichum fructicola]KAE9575591.1 hypothetical protein CGMCC3_g8223 [Colletotrichum fructicola]KAF4411284.1 hypothetical protein CFRS1_v006498 [Colletotrichum fructicola]KAF4883809.1 hypothetical protein CGCFRS4_v013258 [Colletotrichum fructicola]